jgi:hypothetical protein
MLSSVWERLTEGPTQNISHSQLSRIDFGNGHNFFLQRTVFEELRTTTPAVYSSPSLYMTSVALLTTLRATRPIAGMDKRLFPFPKRSDQAWGPASRV